MTKIWTFKKIIRIIHLWLGLTSGLLVVFLGVTGCVLVFEKEIESITEPLKVPPQQKPFALPSRLKTAAEQEFGPGRKVITIEYPGKDRSALAYYYNSEEYLLALINPYTAQVLKTKNMNRDFFRIVTNGHYYLWLPPAIGQPIVASATLVFLVMLVTGIILWWPRNKGARKQRFAIKWNARWRRKNYDLHSVLGFYMSWIAIFIAITGLVMGFQWFANSVYWLSSGGSGAVSYSIPASDTARMFQKIFNPVDQVFQRMYAQTPDGAGISIDFPATNTDPISFSYNHRPGTYYNLDNYHFDQYTLKELRDTGTYSGKFSEAKFADKIARMNYDIHVGAIGGIPTKILAFFGSLIAASLPVTGFLMWRGKRKKVPEKTPIKLSAELA